MKQTGMLEITTAKNSGKPQVQGQVKTGHLSLWRPQCAQHQHVVREVDPSPLKPSYTVQVSTQGSERSWNEEIQTTSIFLTDKTHETVSIFFIHY